MAAAVSNPVRPSNWTRLTPSHARTSSRSPTRSPVHRTHIIAREVDPLLSNLSPDSTLRALEATDTIVKGAAGQDALARSIADASTTERKLGIKAAVAAQKLRQWKKEVSNWPWPEKDNQALGYGFLSPRKGTTKFEYLGSLPLRTVQAYEERLEEIRDDIETLDLDEVKEYVFSAHVPQSSPRIGSEKSDVNGRNYGRMRDFTALITATVVQALPDLAELSSLLDTWDIRLSVLREVPELTSSLETVSAGVQTASKIVNDPVKGKLVSREEVKTTRSILGKKISNLGNQVDKLLDLLEGEQDALPQAWVDTLEDIESKYSDWVVEADQVVLRNEMSNFDEKVVQRNGYRTSMAAAQFAKGLREQRNSTIKGFTRVSILSFPSELSSKASEQQLNAKASAQSLKPEALTLKSNVAQNKTQAAKSDYGAGFAQTKPLQQPHQAQLGHVRDLSEISLADSYLSGYSFENAEVVDARSTQVQSSPIISIIQKRRSSEDEMSWFTEPNKQAMSTLQPDLKHPEAKPPIETLPKTHLKPFLLGRTDYRDESRISKDSLLGTPAKALQRLEGRELQPLPLKTNHQQSVGTVIQPQGQPSSSGATYSNKAATAIREKSTEHEIANVQSSLSQRPDQRLAAQTINLHSRPNSISIDESNHSRQTSNTVDDSDYSRQTSSTVADSMESRPTSYSVQDVIQPQSSSRNPTATNILKPVQDHSNNHSLQIAGSNVIPEPNPSRSVSNSSTDSQTILPAPQTYTSASQNDSVQTRLEGKIRVILKTLPIHVQIVNDENFLDSHTDYFSIQKHSLSPSAILALSPMKRSRITKQDVELGIRGYYLSQLIQARDVPPVKLLVRAVGENRDRVVVRVGGTWVDFPEYLHDYIRHHCDRSHGENKLDLAAFPNRKSSLPAMSPMSVPTEVPELPKMQSIDYLSPISFSPTTFDLSLQQPQNTSTPDTLSPNKRPVMPNQYSQRFVNRSKGGSVSPRPRSPTATTTSPKLDSHVGPLQQQSPTITVQSKQQIDSAASPRPRSPSKTIEYLQNSTYGVTSPRLHSSTNAEASKKQSHDTVTSHSRSPVIGAPQKPVQAAISPETQSPMTFELPEKHAYDAKSPRSRSPTKIGGFEMQPKSAMSPRERSPPITDSAKQQAQGGKSPGSQSPSVTETVNKQTNGTLSPRPRSPVGGETAKKPNPRPFVPSRLSGKSLDIPRSPKQGSQSPSMRSPTTAEFPALPISRSVSPAPPSPGLRESSKQLPPVVPGIMFRQSTAGANKIEPGTTLDFNTWRARKSSVAMWRDPKAAPPPVPAIPSLYTGTNTPMGGSTTNLLAPPHSPLAPPPSFRRTNSVGPSRTLSSDRWANPQVGKVQGLGLSLGYSQSHENLSSVHMMKNTTAGASSLSTMSRQPSLRRPSSRLWRSRPESRVETNVEIDDSTDHKGDLSRSKSKGGSSIRNVFSRKKSDR